MAGTDCGVNFAAGLAVSIVTAVGRQACYCYEFNNLATKLRKEQEDLISIRDDVQSQLNEDKANNKEPSRYTERKFEEANELIDKVSKLKEEAEAKKSCCDGVCPNWICRCLVGKKAKEKTEAMKQLNNELRPKLPFSRHKSLKYVCPSEDFIPFKCTEDTRNAILRALKDDKKIRIGLHGMGGCGKTSLLEEVRKEVEDRKLFKTAFAVVSSNPSYYAIQQSIAECIGLTFKTEKYVRDRAAKLLMAFQEDKKYLVILDDVWQFLDFRDIGIPVRENCKVLLSTRQRQIFDMMKFDAPIDLLLLTNEEALELFKTYAGEIKDPFQEVAQQITYECHRLPVAIKAVARTLKDKELHAWKDGLRTLKDRRRPLNIEKGLEDPYRCLKYSINELDAKEISLDLLCALWPSDSEIATEAMIRFAFGLDIFRDIHSYETARNRVRTAIDKFKDHCLLFKEGRYVKLHDMFHASALWEAKGKTQVITGPRQLVAQADCMKDTNRLYCHGAEEFPDQLLCPELEILIVSNNGECPSKFPDMFFQQLMKLKVLAIKNASIQTKPDLLLLPSIEGLKMLRTFCLRGCTLINISMFEKLEMLHTIELLDCVMTELPKELANLESLKLLEVSNCEIEGNPYKVLATYLRLEELYFVENHLPEMVPTAQNMAEFFHQIGSFKDLRS
ncbi:probable disease resistance protein At4g27220 [Neltuma alba]|uniref:probable disease resistance protein At4g27220 n=1 Tax=Neltuma alba TaxID=207710 RepID=UPI0010A54AE2|nr:probable disease resistance protein At4g27220 [Prosopis alba]